MSERVRKRRWCVLNAALLYHSTLIPVGGRDAVCWLLLLEWASLGGTLDEVPT